MVLKLKQDIVYGPVRSRRLGWSLGINILSPLRKICSFNCLYCQYGWTGESDIHACASELPTAADVAAALSERLPSIAPAPAFLTLSGNGEPTLHPDFPDIVSRVREARDRFCPEARIAILSNASRAAQPEVREALSFLDLCIMKLDVGRQDFLEGYNQPSPSIQLAEIVDTLQGMPGLVIQSLFSSGPAGNYCAMNLEPWQQRIRCLAPTKVQLYTLDREAPSNQVEAVNRHDLETIRNQLGWIGIAAEVF